MMTKCERCGLVSGKHLLAGDCVQALKRRVAQMELAKTEISKLKQRVRELELLRQRLQLRVKVEQSALRANRKENLTWRQMMRKAMEQEPAK